MFDHRCASRSAIVVGLVLSLASALVPAQVLAQATVTQIIDSSGDGVGNRLNGPRDIAVDGIGNVYVTGDNSSNAFRITPAGTITEIIDDSGDGAGNGLSRASGIAVDGAGNVYVAGELSFNAFQITPAGTITQIIDSSGDGAGNPLEYAVDIAADDAGNVYVAGSRDRFIFNHNNSAFEITPAGAITEIIDTSGDGAGNPLDYTTAIAVDGAGNVYVAAAADVFGTGSNNAFQITPAGTITEIIDGSGDGAGNTLDSPSGIAVDDAGNVYVAAAAHVFGTGSNNAFRITSAGTITEIIDGSGDGAGNTLDSPSGIAVDDAGNVYIAGANSDNAFRITPAGTITEIIDGSGDGAGNTLDSPSGIAVDDAGNVYVTGFQSSNAFQIRPRPLLCEVAMSQRSYVLGETLEMTTLRFANLSTGPLHTRVRVLLLYQHPLGTLLTRELADVGADGTFGLPAGFDYDFGPVPMSIVEPIMPTGTWSLRCALEHPLSGAVQAEGFFPFEVQ